MKTGTPNTKPSPDRPMENTARSQELSRDGGSQSRLGRPHLFGAEALEHPLASCAVGKPGQPKTKGGNELEGLGEWK
jgi:hypothetical protein